MIVVAAEPGVDERADELAAELGLSRDSGRSPAADGLALVVRRERLELADAATGGPIWVDYVAGGLGRRRREGTGRRQPLARAAGWPRHPDPRVVDATAGLARDAFLLASAGATVTAWERSPVLAALVRDGLARASRVDELADVVARLRVEVVDSLARLPTLAGPAAPEVVVLDPMFPERNKAALVKKEMRVLRRLLGPDEDGRALLRAALGTATRRVVVKRPARAAPIAVGRAPDLAFGGRTTRFDVYLVGTEPPSIDGAPS